MIVFRTLFTRSAPLFAFCLLQGTALQAQDFPVRPLRVVVPWPPAGTVDLLARPLAVRVSEVTGQPVVVDNRPGANSIVGSEIVAKAVPDGYTLLIDNVTGHAINATLYKQLPFDSSKDFAPVALVASVTNLLVVPPSTGWRTVKDIIAATKAKPGQIAYASFGTGSTAHLAGELFKTQAGIDIVHVPYKGGAPALIDVMAGRTPIMFATLPSAIGYAKGGKLTAVATTGLKRSPSTPEVPTVAESGLTGFEATTWYGALYPARTPPKTVQIMYRYLADIANEPSTRERLSQLGFEVQTQAPDSLSRHLKDETVKWGNIVRVSGAKPD
jgi:tripartite-type tricarboxylate transporter receptor subunit TctC